MLTADLDTSPVPVAAGKRAFPGACTEDEHRTLPSTDSEGPVVTKRELIAYWLYINGNNGNGPQNYSATIFQGLATSAGYESAYGPSTRCISGSSTCVVPWAGGTKSVDSIVLLSNGISFAILTLIFITIGSVADYDNVSRWLLLGLTLICWAAQYSSLALGAPSSWKWAMALYMISFISYGATLMFYIAVFPRLARSTPRSRELREKYENGEIGHKEYEIEESMEKNRISNWATINNNIGYLCVSLVNLSVLLPLAGNPFVNNYTIILCSSYWVVIGIWWFIFQQPRPGPPVPKGTSMLTFGSKQIWMALRQCKRLPNTFTYILAFFFLADGVNTTQSLILIIQNEKFNFSFLMNTYSSIANGSASVLSCLALWYIQKHYKISAKTMLGITNIGTIMIPLWGMVGMMTTKFGLHNAWEFWACNVLLGVFQAPFYAFSQTIMAELVPPGYENMFFSLYGFSNVSSNVIGPLIVQGIIGIRKNKWDGFAFLFFICLIACLIIAFRVDVQKGKSDAIAWAEARLVPNHVWDDTKSSKDKVMQSGQLNNEKPLVDYKPTVFGRRGRSDG
ncbi:hypothetical protein BOTBODRAFT_30053 [Botryobasidium botryosum FD-172 SS1]|uniref:Autophagy-related protein n=1 Tax=Botryobasidium botryosum (strain FD-172 SS1) TaxID=930990 RepID=A0A067MZB6_BOTB1|nr:hypothetical protein BOTBODRAFT_30053 [Botryobasidium botryosum FD-172 SS1]